MSNSIAQAYKSTSRLGESPDIGWLLSGIRGLQTYARKAIRALRDNDIPTRLDATARAADLLVFLQNITASDSGAELGQRLIVVYTNLHIQLVNANSGMSESLYRDFLEQCSELEALIISLQEHERS